MLGEEFELFPGEVGQPRFELRLLGPPASQGASRPICGLSAVELEPLFEGEAEEHRRREGRLDRERGAEYGHGFRRPFGPIVSGAKPNQELVIVWLPGSLGFKAGQLVREDVRGGHSPSAGGRTEPDRHNR